MRFAGFSLGRSPGASFIDQGIQLRQAGRTAEALDCFLKAIEADPRASAPHNLAGLCYFELGDYARAHGCYSRAIERNPRDANVWGNRAAAQNALGNRAGAIDDATKALELSPGHDDWRSLRGELYRLAGRFDEALADLSQAVMLAPHKPDYCYLLGRVLMLLGRWDAAIGSYQQALQHGNEALRDLADDALNELGLCHLEMGRPEAALLFVDAALRISPDWPTAWFNRGAICRELGRFDEALAAYDRAAEINPADPDIYARRGLCHRDRGDTAAAVADLRAALQLDRDRTFDRLELGALLVQRDEYDAALAELKTVLRQEPASSVAHHWIAYLHERRQDPDAAIKAYNRAIELAPTKAEFYSDRGDCWAKLDRKEEALRDWRQALRLKPDLEAAAFFLIDWCVKWRDETPAREMLKGKLAQAPDDPQTHHWQAYFHNAFHRREEAIECYSRAIELDPPAARFYSARGELLFRLDRFAGSIADYTEAIRLDPGTSRHYNGRGEAWQDCGQWQEAIDDFSTAIRIAPRECAGYHNRGDLLFQRGRLPEALADLENAVAVHPEGKNHWTARGLIQLAMGNRSAADADFQEASRERLEELREMQAAGKLVRAVLVQANSHLFARGLSDYPGYVLFSFERELNQSPNVLREIAERMFEIKRVDCDDPGERFVSALISDEIHRGDERALLPVSFTGGAEVYGSGLMFHRPFLRDGYLTERVFPCLADLGPQGRIRLVPHWAVGTKTKADMPA